MPRFFVRLCVSHEQQPLLRAPANRPLCGVHPTVLQGAGPMGGGDALMSLLGVVIISFGFRVYTQRDTMKRHFPEIVGATILSSIFSLFSTAFAAKAIGLSAGG